MLYQNYFLYLLIIIAIPLIAQVSVKNAISKYSKVRSSSGMNGEQVARMILDQNGLQHVKVEQVRDGDHYDPRAKAVRLSAENFQKPSVAAAAIAAHECGHAIQDKEGYFFLNLRSAIVPLASLGSRMSWILILAGIIFQASQMFLVGIIFMLFAVVFQLVTLPVEFNASSRAMTQLAGVGIIAGEEQGQAKTVLNAAAMTYVAATAVAVLELLRFVLIFRGMNDD